MHDDVKKQHTETFKAIWEIFNIILSIINIVRVFC